LQKQPEPAQYPELKEGMQINSADGKRVGEVLEVFRDLGTVETFGTVGLRPEQEGFDPTQYAFSEAMPGAGDDYFTARQQDGTVLYIPFSSIFSVDGKGVTVTVDADNIPDMQWTVRPDALAAFEHEYETDTGAEPHVA
jgi:hypothetical protein